MASPPITDRQYAYVHISGPGTHEDVTARLQLKPSEAWNAGDVDTRNGRPRRSMSWRLRSGLDDTHPLDGHLECLLTGLGTRAEELRSLWVDFDLTLQCVGYFAPSGHGVHFTREHIRKAAQLGLAFDLDFYFIDDHGHEA